MKRGEFVVPLKTVVRVGKDLDIKKVQKGRDIVQIKSQTQILSKSYLFSEPQKDDEEKKEENENEKERAFGTEILDQKFLNSAPVIDPSSINIFGLSGSKTVLYRGANDALIAQRYINESSVQSIELKYYNESSGSQARSYLINFQITSPTFSSSVSGSPFSDVQVYHSVRRGPMVVPSNKYASLGVIHKTPDVSGKFGFFMFIDVAVSQTPPSALNTGETFIASFTNSF